MAIPEKLAAGRRSYCQHCGMAEFSVRGNRIKLLATCACISHDTETVSAYGLCRNQRRKRKETEPVDRRYLHQRRVIVLSNQAGMESSRLKPAFQRTPKRT